MRRVTTSDFEQGDWVEYSADGIRLICDLKRIRRPDNDSVTIDMTIVVVCRTMEQDMSMIAVNVVTLTKLTKLFLSDMIKRGSGRVLNVSSTAAMMPGPRQAVYYATKAFVTSMSNSIWQELKGTGVTLTTLMPGAMSTGFAKAGGLQNTPLFAHPVEPAAVAKAGYEGMLKGKLNVVSGLTFVQKIFMSMAPLLPKKMMLKQVYDMQTIKK